MWLSKVTSFGLSSVVIVMSLVFAYVDSDAIYENANKLNSVFLGCSVGLFFMVRVHFIWFSLKHFSIWKKSDGLQSLPTENWLSTLRT